MGILRRTLHAATPARWVTGDEVYGNDPGLRTECETQRIGYVLIIGCCRRVPPRPARPRRHPGREPAPLGVAAAVAGSGAKGELYYDWAWITRTPHHADKNEDDSMAMLAHALLAVIAVHEHTDQLTSAGPIPLICSEIRACSPS